jgi:prevent-host-death family protein
MERRITATEARVHFGEVLRRVVELGEQVIVERDGRPQIVMLSIAEFERLRGADRSDDEESLLAEIVAFGAAMDARRNGQPFTPPVDILDEVREERDAQRADLR